ncbi:MAG: CheR family methyltransferase, partial [Planctomycetaceae bacterium]
MINGVMKPYSLIGDGYFEPLKEYVIAATGLSYYRNRNGELIDHFERHVANVGLTDCLSYLQLLQSGPAGDGELDSLIEDLTIGETFFFRHTDLFAALERTILPDAIDRNKHHRRLRIWSAGSSIGAEAYTISILLRRHFAEELRDWEISIVGTDINRSFLFRAAQAQFEEWTLRGVSEDTRRACFTQCDNVWTLRPEFKSGVSFAYHNLARHPFPSMLHNLFAFDVILFRNVMIYFGQDALTSIIANMQRCLIDGGWLLVGHSEHNQELFREFRTVNFDGAIAYQRADGDPGAVSGPSCRRP